MTNPEFKDKFIAFVDILGFKNLVRAAETETGMSLPDLLKLTTVLGGPEDQKKIEKHGPVTCPRSKYFRRDLDFKLTQISDCVVVSCEISPAGVINLIGHCWGVVIQMLTKGILCRGFITRGQIFHTDIQFIGSGYQEAYRKESEVTAFKKKADERGTPFVEVDSVVCEYISGCGDQCVKEMFSRFVREDGNVTALFPFKRLAHSFVVAGWGQTFDPEKEKLSNQQLRLGILTFKERINALVDKSNSDAVNRADHYVAALDAQLKICDETDEMIDKLSSPFPARRW